MSDRSHRSLRALIVGFGSIGKRHAKNLSALGVHDIAVCDLDPARRLEAEALLGSRSVEHLAEALADRPDMVFVTTPPASHLPIATAAAEAGCALFIEKPLSDSLEGADRLLARIHAKHLVSLVGCNMRFHHGPSTMKRLLVDGAIGRVVTALLDAGQYLPDWHPDEDYRRLYAARRELGGGVVLDGIHELDYARWLFGEPSRVFAMGGRLSGLEIDTEDCANVLVEFGSGSLAHIHLDYIQRVYGRTCKIIGEEGTILWDMTAGMVRLYRSATQSWTAFAAPADYPVNQMYVEELRHFLQCVKGEAPPMQDVDEALRSMRLALAAKASIETGRSVLLEHLPEPLAAAAAGPRSQG